MTDNEQMIIRQTIASLAAVQSSLTMAMSMPTNEALSAVKQAADQCNAIIVTLPPALMGKISIYWTSGVMAQLSTLSMYDAMPAMKLTMAQSFLPIINTNVCNCTAALLSESASTTPQASQPTMVPPTVTNPTFVPPVSPVVPMPTATPASNQAMAPRASAYSTEETNGNNLIKRMRELCMKGSINIADHIAEYAPNIDNLLIEGSVDDGDGNDFIDFIESDNNFAFSDLKQCIEELHTPDNLPLIDRNASFAESVERAVKLWELANDFLEIRNASLCETAEQLARLYDIGRKYIEDNAQYKATHPRYKGVPANTQRYVKEQTDKLKRYFMDEVDESLLEEMKALVNWGKNPEPEKESPAQAAKEANKGNEEKLKTPHYHIKVGVWLGMVGMICLSAALILTQIFDKEILPVVGYFLVAVTAITYIAVIVMFFKNKKEMLCPKCKQYYNFNTDINYQLIDEIYKQHKINPNASTRQITESLTYKYQIDCTCHNCGHKRSFSWKTRGGNAYSDGTTQYTNPHNTIRNYWSSHSITGTSKGENIFGFVLMGICLIIAVLTLALGSIASAADPKPAKADGIYYGISEGIHYTVELDGKKAVITRDNGMKTETEEFNVSYLTAKKAQERMANSQYVGCGGILLRLKDDKDNGTIIWVEDNGDATYYVLNEGNTLLSSTDTTLSSYMNDPKNYYRTYRYNAINEVTLYPSGEASYLADGERDSYKYLYVNAEWIKYNLNKTSSTSTNSGIVLFKPGTDECYLFYYNSIYNRLEVNSYYFNAVAGSEISSANAQSDSANAAAGNNNSSNSNTSNGSGGSNSSGTS